MRRRQRLEILVRQRLVDRLDRDPRWPPTSCRRPATHPRTRRRRAHWWISFLSAPTAAFDQRLGFHVAADHEGEVAPDSLEGRDVQPRLFGARSPWPSARGSRRRRPRKPQSGPETSSTSSALGWNSPNVASTTFGPSLIEAGTAGGDTSQARPASTVSLSTGAPQASSTAIASALASNTPTLGAFAAQSGGLGPPCGPCRA